MTDIAATDALPAPKAAPARRNPALSFLARLVREKPLGAFGALLCLLLLVTGLFADQLAPRGHNQMALRDRLEAPSLEYPMGTDQLGRDVLSRVIHGAQLSIIIGFSAAALSIVISVVLGLVTGWFGGRIDLVTQRFVDAWMSFPDIIILIAAVSVLGPGMWQVIAVLTLVYGIGGSRIIRGAVLGVKENTFVRAAEAAGASDLRIIVVHILPNIMAPIIVLFTTRLGAVIIVEASLSFLGLGVPPPAPSWGGMLSGEGRRFMLTAWWLAVFPGLALTIAVFGINMFGDALRDLLDPRMRGGGGRYRIARR